MTAVWNDSWYVKWDVKLNSVRQVAQFYIYILNLKIIDAGSTLQILFET